MRKSFREDFEAKRLSYGTRMSKYSIRTRIVGRLVDSLLDLIPAVS